MSEPSNGSSKFGPFSTPRRRYLLDSSISRRVFSALREVGWDVQTVSDLFRVRGHVSVGDEAIIRRCAREELAWVTADDDAQIRHGAAIRAYRVSVLWVRRPPLGMRPPYMLAVLAAALGHFDARLGDAGDRAILCEVRDGVRDDVVIMETLPRRRRRLGRT